MRTLLFATTCPARPTILNLQHSTKGKVRPSCSRRAALITRATSMNWRIGKGMRDCLCILIARFRALWIMSGYVSLQAGRRQARSGRGRGANIQGNVRQLADYYFDSPGTRRNAFIERIGRELTIFGLEMTNEGDLAVQKPRATASSNVQGEK